MGKDLELGTFLNRDPAVAATQSALLEAAELHGNVRSADTVHVDEHRSRFDSPGDVKGVIDVVVPHRCGEAKLGLVRQVDGLAKALFNVEMFNC